MIAKAAIAHLNVVSVHPFRAGNGRVSRIVQALVLAREGRTISPEFSSIEEYLDDHTADYYAALRDAQGGSYQLERDASNDFRRLLDSGLIRQTGRGRTVRYRASADLVKGVDLATGKTAASHATSR